MLLTFYNTEITYAVYLKKELSKRLKTLKKHVKEPKVLCSIQATNAAIEQMMFNCLKTQIWKS